MLKTTRMAAGLLALAMAAPGASAAAGGPDGFGYTWRDSNEPGVTYAWEDISATGTDITVAGDDVNTGFRGLSFAFPYYGGGYTQVAASSNGWASLLDGTSGTYFNQMLPAPGIPTSTVAAFWDDLTTAPATGTPRILFQDFGTRAVITWENVPDLGNEAAVNTFQLIFYNDGRIKAQYQNITGDRTSFTAGIESPDELNGLTAWFDDIAGTFPTSNYAIEYDPPVPVPANLDCTRAVPLACGDRMNGDTRAGVANQDAYLCSRGDYSGKELVYEMNLAAPTTLRLVLESQTGSQQMVVVSNCDPNICLAAPTMTTTLPNVSGRVDIVIDSAPGQEGAFQLRVDCLPLTADVDCANATPINCGDTVTGDLATGQARQDAYGCTLADYSGREQVYRLDLRAPTNVEFNLTELSGNPDLIVINACDPNTCQILDAGQTVINDLNGSVYIVIDSAAGEEGQYELSLNCLTNNMAFCADGLLEMDPWGYANGVWLVNGWLYHPGDTHDFALRVDGGTATYSTGGSCPNFTTTGFGVRMPNGPAFVDWGAPEGSVRSEMYQTSLGTCCGLMVNMTVTNTDTVPHYYEYRVYHDTAFGTGDGTGDCGAGSTIDGGPVEVNGIRYWQELDLLSVGGDTCAGQLQMFSNDHPTDIKSSFEMLPPNLPIAMEYLDWNDGGAPCTTWKGLADGYTFGACATGGFADNSVLFIWRFPQFGTLNPGESATARYRIGRSCAWPCNVACEFPTLASAAAADAGPCQGGVVVSWAGASFPGAGNGVFHVYRSTVSAADALTQPPVTPNGGVTGTSWIDGSTVAGPTYYYVVKAESLDFPNCGDGPAVLGSTATANAPAVQDFADIDPPTTAVGAALRATGKTDSTVDFKWVLAPPPAADEHYVVLRADNDPRGPFLNQAEPVAQTWTDPNAPATFGWPAHCWFYDVRIADACGNISADVGGN